MAVGADGKYFLISAVRFTNDMKTIVVATSEAWIQVRTPRRSVVARCACNPPSLLASAVCGAVQLYSSRSGRLVCQRQLDGEVSCLNVSPSDSFLCVGRADGKVRVLCVASSSCSRLWLITCGVSDCDVRYRSSRSRSKAFWAAAAPFCEACENKPRCAVCAIGSPNQHRELRQREVRAVRRAPPRRLPPRACSCHCR
jgi:hypothetical protein